MRLVVLVALMLFGGLAKSTEIRCDNCTEYQYQQSAKQAGIGAHYIYDLVKGNSRQYMFERNCEEGRRCSPSLTALSVHPDVKKVVTELAAYHAVTAGQMSSRFTFHADNSISGMNAFDVAGPGGPRTRLIDWLNSSESLTIRNALPMEGTVLHNMAVSALAIFKNSMGATIITVQFTDGSRINFSYESINNTFTYVEGSAVDSLGNVIPTTREELNGLRFDYSREPGGPAERRMREYLKIYGVTVTGSTKWACVFAGDSVKCQPF